MRRASNLTMDGLYSATLRAGAQICHFRRALADLEAAAGFILTSTPQTRRLRLNVC